MQIKINRLTILSCHSILDQVAEDIAKGIAVDALPDKDIVVCIGAHKRFRGLRQKAGFKICVQTEHFLDARGQALWRKPRWFRMLTNLLICDLISTDDITSPFGDKLAGAGEIRDGGSFYDRMGAVACWNAVMDENQYMVRKWNEFIAA